MYTKKKLKNVSNHELHTIPVFFFSPFHDDGDEGCGWYSECGLLLLNNSIAIMIVVIVTIVMM